MFAYCSVKLPQDTQHSNSLDSEILRTLNNKLIQEIVTQHLFSSFLGVASPPLHKQLEDPKMAMKTFLFLQRVGLINVFHQNFKVNIL